MSYWQAGRGAEMRTVLLAGILAAGMAAPAWAGGVTVQDGWMRMTMPSHPAAGYFVLHNDTDAALKLTGAESPGCGDLMLHRSVSEGGQEKMEMVMEVPVPAHGSVAFAPGGYHLMCMEPTTAMKQGGSVPVTLRFGDGSQVQATFAVKSAMGE